MSLEDGVYVGLASQTYFDQPRLGSTDHVILHRRPADYFYATPSLNTRWRPEPVSEPRDFGSGLHALLLEGEDVFRQMRIVRPDTYPDEKAGAEKPWNGNAGWCKNWLEENLTPGQTLFTEDMEFQVRHMAALISNHPEFKESFLAENGMSELSILFHMDDLPCRARLDRLLPQFVLDLKSYGAAVVGRDHREKALLLVERRDYDVQRYLYDVSRMRMVEFVRQGRVFGASEDQMKWLRRVVDEPRWDWVWLFYQRRSDKYPYAAPILTPIRRPPMDTTFESGRQKVAVAQVNWRRYLERFGLSPDQPWATIEAMWTPADHDFSPRLSDVAGAHFEDDDDQ